MPWPGRRLPDRQFIAPLAPGETERASLYPDGFRRVRIPPYPLADVPEEERGDGGGKAREIGGKSLAKIA